MNYPYLIGMTVFVILFTSLLFSLGLNMMRINSMEQELATYREDPKNGTLVQKYFLWVCSVRWQDRSMDHRQPRRQTLEPLDQNQPEGSLSCLERFSGSDSWPFGT